MDDIGMDVHRRDTQVCIIDADGTVVLEQRIRTERTRIVLEASTESEWVAAALETPDHEVVVAGPNFTPDVRDADPGA